MPRRYADYADCFFFWHKISRWGSLIGMSATIMFCFIVWEILYSRRAVVFGNHLPRMGEWMIAKEKFPVFRHPKTGVAMRHTPSEKKPEGSTPNTST